MNNFATARSFMLIGFPVLFFNLAAAETYCAFEVKVSTPGGTPAPNVTVALIRADRTTFSETTTDANGVARLCDAPLEYMDVIAGRDVCGLVMVKHVQPTWPEMRRVYVTYADAPCNHFVPAPDCRVLLRIQDEGGHAVAGARFKSKSTSVNCEDDMEVKVVLHEQ
jgi:hypothetical protein